MSEPLGYYLRSNPDNFIGILRTCVDYYLANDYKFYSKSKNPEKYAAQAEKLKERIADMETNKLKYQDTLARELETLISNFERYVEMLKKK